MCDGSGTFLRDDGSPETVRKLVTPTGGERVSMDEL